MTGGVILDAPPVVYVGPSLPLDRAEALLPTADFRPPIKRGDLPTRYEGTIVIIDGGFHQSLSVSPKEILRLLDGGTVVIGASSMGALRAAELARYGMRGCGWVFEAYRSGRITADDEVAVTYSVEDFTCLTVPLVNVRCWLECLELRGLVDATTSKRLLATTRSVFYADRTQTSLMRKWDEAVPAAEVRRLLRASGGAITDVKGEDAALALTMAGEGSYGEGKESTDERTKSTEKAASATTEPGPH